MTMIEIFNCLRQSDSRCEVVLLVAVLQVIIALPVLADTALNDAIALYGKRDYGSCLRKLDSIDKRARSANSEYYRALSLQALHRYDESMQAYRTVAAQKQDGNLAQLAQKGMLGLGNRPKNRSFTPSSFAGTGGGAVALGANGSSARKSASLTASEKTDASDSNEQGSMPAGWGFAKTSSGCGRH